MTTKQYPICSVKWTKKEISEECFSIKESQKIFEKLFSQSVEGSASMN